MDDPFARLEADYCPPLDPALLSAIVSDYDLSDAQSVADARATLDELKASALLEEAAGFDPSGTGARDAELAPEKRAESCPETSASLTGETDVTSLSTGLSTLDLDELIAGDNTSIGNAEDLEKLDDDTKVKLLQELFGDRVSQYSVQYTLKKCNGKWQAAMEELLNHVYFDEADHSDDSNKVASKGIDAFSEENVARRGRKGKSKGKRGKSGEERRAVSLPGSPVEGQAPSANKWQTASEDVEFVASRSRIATATVSSVYYAKGASVPRTIGALLKASMEESKHVVTDDGIVSQHARDLGFDFPSVAPDYLAALIRLTHPSTSSARELATALTARPKELGNGGIQIIPQYVSPLANESDASWQSTSKTQRAHAGSRSSDTDTSSTTARASAYASARATAFSQASAAHRKARSDRLMGGAAAYYGQVGREYAALSSGAIATAADELVSTQSSSNQLDLHGVDVLNAVRIARENVEGWWYHGVGESRVNGRVGAADRIMGYRIVVGLGRHSEGGKGKLGPAVTKMLKAEGWRVEPSGAVIVVRGRARQ